MWDKIGKLCARTQEPTGAQGTSLLVSVAVLIAVCCSLSAPPARAQEIQLEREKIQQAQELLSALGYDPGGADGKIGRRTRRAIKAFQQTYNLPATGKLDTPTLSALGLPPPKSEKEPPPPSLPPLPRPTAPPSAPWRAVLAYMRYFDTQPARIVSYVTKHFRQGLEPHQWIAQTITTLNEQNFSRVSWQIERVESDPAHQESRTTVYVQSRVRINGEEIARREIFSLVRSHATEEWRINDWQSSIVSSARPQAAEVTAGR